MNNEYILVILIIIIFIFYNYCYKSNSQEEFQDIQETDNNILTNKKNYVLLFYSKDCNYSMEYIPMYNNLKKGGHENLIFLDLDINNPLMRKIANSINVIHTPSLVWFNHDGLNNFSHQSLNEALMFSNFEIYNGVYELKYIMRWLKSKGVSLKQSYIETFDNHSSNKIKDDLEMRYGSSGNRCKLKNIKFFQPEHKNCYPVTLFKKPNDIYCIHSKYQEGCINPKELGLKPINGAYNIVSSYLDTINYETESGNEKDEIIGKCADSIKEDLNEFGLCDNQQFLNDLKKYDNFTKSDLTDEKCNNTDYSNNSLYSDAITKACKKYKKGIEY